MASNTEISNLALAHLGIGKRIANLTTEQSQEAAVCRVFYETSLDEILRDFAWPFATKFVALGLVEEDPTTEWAFSYRYPSDCLDLRRIFSGVRDDSRQSRVPYKLGQDASGVLIYTDIEDAEVEYTYRADDPQFFPPDFTMAFSFLLASYIAATITGGDPFKLSGQALQKYSVWLSKAKAKAGNEEQPSEEVDSEFVRERN